MHSGIAHTDALCSAREERLLINFLVLAAYKTFQTKKDQAAFNLLPESSSQNEMCYDQVLKPRREMSANGSAFFARAATGCSSSAVRKEEGQ